MGAFDKAFQEYDKGKKQQSSAPVQSSIPGSLPGETAWQSIARQLKPNTENFGERFAENFAIAPRETLGKPLAEFVRPAFGAMGGLATAVGGEPVREAIEENPINKLIFGDKEKLVPGNVLEFGGQLGLAVLNQAGLGTVAKSLAPKLLKESAKKVGLVEFAKRLGESTAIGGAYPFLSGLAEGKTAQESAKRIPAGLAIGFGVGLPLGALGARGAVAEGRAENQMGRVVQRTLGEIMPPTSENMTPVEKLIAAVKGAKPMRAELEQAYSAERSARAGMASSAMTNAPGEKGYFDALSKLKGPLVEKPRTFTGIKNDLMQEDVDALFVQIQQHPDLQVFDKIAASHGLADLFEGRIPPNSILSLLEDVFGRKLIATVMDKRPMMNKLTDLATSVWNVPKSLMSTFDMSGALRQGAVLTVTKPKISIPALGQAFKDVFSPKAFGDWLDGIKKTPEYQLMKASKLYIADSRRLTGGPLLKEEAFMSNLAERIPIIGHIVRASERGYIGFLNRLRVGSFNDIAAKFIKTGLDPVADKKVFESLANFVNTATGRGNLGALEKSAQLLNFTFFSPRLIASRFNMLNPFWYLSQAPQVRREAIKSFAEFVGVGLSVLALAQAGGAAVETDPRSTDFGKIRIGDTRWDVWAGFQQWARFFAQLETGERKTAKGNITKLTGEKFPFETRADLIGSFTRGKLSPTLSLALELISGRNAVGDKMTPTESIAKSLIPLYLKGIRDAYKEMGPSAFFRVGVPTFFGIGTQTYK